MLNKQKLVDMMKSLKRQETINEFWRNATPDQTKDSLKKLVVEFDLEKDQIKMKSDAVNVNGEALFEWTLDSETGEIMEATRE